MLHWIAFNALLPLSPVAMVWFASWIVNKKKSIFSIIRDGQLCFYCSATSVVFVKDVPSGQIGEIFGAVLLIAFFNFISIFIYGIAVTHSDTMDSLAEKKLGITSMALALATTVTVAYVRYQYGLL